MKQKSTWLLDYKRDVYSQTGEDGIIEKILDILPENDRWCVEFGAWDGLYLTNTRHLIEDKGYSAILIEGDKGRFQSLKHNYDHTEKVITLNKFVSFKGEDNLDQILGNTLIPYDFDLLSIDIDGNDYHVWSSLKHYRPKVVVIEFNPTIPTNVKFVQPADPSITQGSSLLSLVELGKEKGYELVSVLPFNAFFIRKDLYSIFNIESNDPEVLRTNLNAVTYMFSGYDGKIFLYGYKKLPWHKFPLKESTFQVLPKFLQFYPGNYSKFQKIAYRTYRALLNPKIIKEKFFYKIKPAKKKSNSKN